MSGLDRDLGTCQFRFKTVTNKSSVVSIHCVLMDDY